ncbi:hypothetical protein K4H00_27170, partial [Mycobacterium tuberculosis]|nr:hypothetical protein [Mycobacterium tuberculosis]
DNMCFAHAWRETRSFEHIPAQIGGHWQNNASSRNRSSLPCSGGGVMAWLESICHGLATPVDM